MKKLLFAFALLVCLTVSASAEEFMLDENAAMDGMKLTWYQGYEPAIQGTVMTLCLPIRAEHCVGPITASIALDDPHVYLLSAQPGAVAVSPRDGLYPVKLTLFLQYQRRNGDYPATVTLQGTDAQGNAIQETMPYVIRIRDGQQSHENLQPVIHCEDAKLDVGTEGSLILRIDNPTSTIALSEGVLTITDSSGEVIMQGTDQRQIPEILPGKSETITLPMIVSGDAQVKEHSFRIRLQYQALGQPGFREETLTIPVKQDICLEYGDANLPTVIAGDAGSLTLPLMNVGKGELRNVLVKLELEEMNDISLLVGTMGPGETRQTKLNFLPKERDIGTHAGLVTVSCEDAYGNRNEQIIAVSLTVEEPPPEKTMQRGEKEAKADPVKIGLGVLCGLLAIGWIVTGCLLTGKIHRLEEDRL